MSLNGTSPAAGAPDAAATHALDFPLDLPRTLGPLAHGRGDPTIRIAEGVAWRAWRTPQGAATLRLSASGGRLEASAWGPGAAWAMAAAPGLAGLLDEPRSFVPRHPLLAELARRQRGLRMTRTGLPWEALQPAICEQKVSGAEAWRTFRAIVRAHGEPAPGPGGLWLAPDPSVIARLAYFAFHPLGMERRRAEVLLRAARLAPRLVGLPREEAYRLLRSVPGIGPWTVAETGRVAYGDPDAVSVGDYHLPNLVAWALAGEPRADDARMLELLEPYRGQRARVQLLLETSGIQPPRYGPRMPARRIAHL